MINKVNKAIDKAIDDNKLDDLRILLITKFNLFDWNETVEERNRRVCEEMSDDDTVRFDV